MKWILILSAWIAFASPVLAGDRSEIQWEQKIGSRLPLSTSFVDETGEPKKLSQLFGSAPVILVFTYFRCPNLCSLVLNGLTRTLNQIPENLGADYRIVTLSIDPAEKPKLALMKKRSYLTRLGKVPGTHAKWTFLTGTEPEIRRLSSAAGFRFRLDPVSQEFQHPTGFLVVTPAGTVSQYFMGIRFDPKELDASLQRAKRAELGSVVREILLYCFHYDPSQNPHSRLILFAIRLVALLGIFSIAGLLVYLYLSRPRSSGKVM